METAMRNAYTHDKYVWMQEMYTFMANMHGCEKCSHS